MLPEMTLLYSITAGNDRLEVYKSGRGQYQVIYSGTRPARFLKSLGLNVGQAGYVNVTEEQVFQIEAWAGNL